MVKPQNQILILLFTGQAVDHLLRVGGIDVSHAKLLSQSHLLNQWMSEELNKVGSACQFLHDLTKELRELLISLWYTILSPVKLGAEEQLQ